ncbi:hypothetical protein BGZ61DRAFT_529596 [Ilyonectria robusta]|uniref:uncharacterized protein n=1 Tax=Ilyonectria robusta TaxID=1079257 RepID=UPI001E8D8E52|nr:uncharacterized protein BGZ61DRAFT_529596 [Ilyonectria robusta]KAH8729380.1 hypothetical protein BGZ61DRAFT_529596 [Ilyonectria robusta]
MPHDEQASKHFASSTDFQACSVREPSISELAGLDMGRPPKDKKDRDERWNRGRDNPRILAASLSMQERDAQTLPAPITTPPTLDPHRPISGTTVKRTCKVQAKNGTWRTVDAISTHRKRQKDGELYLGVTKALASRLGYKINRLGNGKRLQHDMKTGLIKCRGTISLPFWKANGQQSVEVVGVWDGPNCSFEVMVDEGAVKEYTMPKRPSTTNHTAIGVLHSPHPHIPPPQPPSFMPTGTTSYIGQVNENQTSGQANEYPANQQANECLANRQLFAYQADQQPYGYQMNEEVAARGGGNFPPAFSGLSNSYYGSLEQCYPFRFDNNANNATNNAQDYETSDTTRVPDGQSIHFNSQPTAALGVDEFDLWLQAPALMPEEYNHVSQNAYSHDAPLAAAANNTPYNQAPQITDQTDVTRSFDNLFNDEQGGVESMVDLQTQQPANPHASRPGDHETSQPRDYQTPQFEDNQPPQPWNWFDMP